MNVTKSQTPWTPERVAALKALWAMPLDARQIAGRLNAGGAAFTRNAIISKAHRLCLPMKKPQPSRTARPQAVAP